MPLEIGQRTGWSRYRLDGNNSGQWVTVAYIECSPNTLQAALNAFFVAYPHEQLRAIAPDGHQVAFLHGFKG